MVDDEVAGASSTTCEQQQHKISTSVNIVAVQNVRLHAKLLAPGKPAALIRPVAGPKFEYSHLQNIIKKQQSHALDEKQWNV